MYSVVLMVALSGSAEAPDCHRCGGSRGSGGGYCSGVGCGGYYGCSGYGSCSGSYGYPGGAVVPPYRNPPEMVPLPGKDKTVPMKVASIKVTLPADAMLTIDGQPTKSSSANRSFVTPPLEPGTVFQYTLRAEFMDNGQKLVETQVVPVRAGQESQVRFGDAVVSRQTADR